MASSYLDLYTSPGGYYDQWGQQVYKPAIGVQQGTYRPGTTQRVVHDTLNNKYYGTQSLDTLTKGIQDAIARNKAKLERGGATYVTNAGTIFQREEFNRYDSAEIKAMNDSIAQQQKYLNTLNSDNYTQEASTFFNSYDAYTQDWDNVFQARKNAADREAANALQEKKNRQIARRNQTIKGENALKEAKASEGSSVSTGSGARAKALTPNLEIGTGLTATAYRGLTKSGLTL